jgi:flagellar motor switch/type III secretory pathway protein FliN
MNEFESIFREEKNDLKNIEIPEELEERLRKALDHKAVIKKKKYGIGKVAAACLVILLIGYNFDSLAFYSKKIIGYNDVMNGTLKQLNELGRGQIINEKYIFENGVVILVDGIMLDESQLLVFYTIEAPAGKADEMMPMFSLKGLLRQYAPESGQGIRNDTNTVLKGVQSFEAPHFLEKKLELSYRIHEDSKMEEGKITFKIDREEAMENILKTSINQTMKVGKSKIRFKSLLASPTKTVLKGSIQNIWELTQDQIAGERLRPKEVQLKLIANDKEVEKQGGGMRTDMNGITFHCDYDALPQDLKSLRLEDIRFLADYDVNQVITLDKNAAQTVQIQGQEIVINKIYQSRDNTFVNITTDEETVLTRVYLLADEKRIELNQTIEGSYEKLKDGRILYTRTLEFDGLGENYKLDVRSISYLQAIDGVIELPVK